MSPPSTTQGVIDAIKAVDKQSLSESERLELLAASSQLQSKLENTWDTIGRLVWRYPALISSIKTLVNLKLFEKWVAAGGGSKTHSELASMVGADEALIVRLIRVVAAEGLADNPAPYTYEMNDFSKALATPPFRGPIEYLWFFQLPSYLAMPQFLAANRYQNPSFGPENTAFNWGLNVSGSMFDLFAARPKYQESFADCMIGYAGSMAPWTDIFPTEQLVQDATPENVIVVDVGGGVGHDLAHLQKKHDLRASQLVLQDHPHVLAYAESQIAFTPQAHDFFTAQPVKGARSYYMHSIMHDWPDKECLDILARLRDAMGPHSRILLHEVVLQAQDTPAFAAQSDVMMMVAFNAHERTEDMWRALLAQVGLQIIQIHTVRSSPQSVIEVRRV